MTKDEQWSFGPFLWFGTKRKDASIYGTYCFEFHFKKVLTKYVASRGNKSSICYRVGGTLLYTEEITHVVIICCKDDNECEPYPVIEPTTTKYFKPPVPKIESTDHVGGSAEETVYPAMMSAYIYSEVKRHEHVALAFYLPHDVVLQLDNQDGNLYDIKRDHVSYCPKASGKFKTCELSEVDESYFSDFNDPFDCKTFFEFQDGDYAK